jgi:hypothetical protein
MASSLVLENGPEDEDVVVADAVDAVVLGSHVATGVAGAARRNVGAPVLPAGFCELTVGWPSARVGQPKEQVLIYGWKFADDGMIRGKSQQCQFS